MLTSIIEEEALAPIRWIVPAIVPLFLLHRIFRAIRDPLKSQPGPFLARFTRLWLIRQFIWGDYHKTNIELHRKYGPIVRIAPSQYSIDSLEAAKIIYGHGSHFAKASVHFVSIMTN
ncbi:hypothetical protein EDB80DRAFT_873425 [Ilyonectria destructans]|nr:hypothetical protein EDB80DRAFT_873425 [Ilyonectria destructans]